MESPHPTLNPFIVASHYESFLEVALKCGLAPSGTTFLTAYSGEDLRGFHVITDDIALADAAFATAVTIIPIQLPEELETNKASAGLLLKYAGPAKTYWVQGSSAVVASLYNGGTTPLALVMARSLAANPEILARPEGELAEELDRLMWGERHAGEETERLLLLMLAAERDRRCAIEAMSFSKPGGPLQAKGH